MHYTNAFTSQHSGEFSPNSLSTPFSCIAHSRDTHARCGYCSIVHLHIQHSSSSIAPSTITATPPTSSTTTTTRFNQRTAFRKRRSIFSWPNHPQTSPSEGIAHHEAPPSSLDRPLPRRTSPHIPARYRRPILKILRPRAPVTARCCRRLVTSKSHSRTSNCMRILTNNLRFLRSTVL